MKYSFETPDPEGEEGQGKDGDAIYGGARWRWLAYAYCEQASPQAVEFAGRHLQEDRQVNIS
jgi:hypothetical protein